MLLGVALWTLHAHYDHYAFHLFHAAMVEFLFRPYIVCLPDDQKEHRWTQFHPPMSLLGNYLLQPFNLIFIILSSFFPQALLKTHATLHCYH